MKEITKAEFKKRCLGFVDEVQRTREPILIARGGSPIAKLIPVEQPDGDIFGYMVGKVKIVGDIVSPVTLLKDWNCK